jgi:8-oxo-dGTP diphosphatase
MSKFTHVAVGILSNADGKVLIARRPNHVHQGGLWEFPGGKREFDELIQAALVRELREELGVELLSVRPLIRVRHSYTDEQVLLDVWRVNDYRGQPCGLQGQPLAWVAPAELPRYSFPAADFPILSALSLPACYLITGEPVDCPTLFLDRLQVALERGVKLVQLRAKSLPEDSLLDLYQQARTLANAFDVPILLNGSSEQAQAVDADGVHLSADQLLKLDQRPLPKNRWVAASCHNALEVLHADQIGVDFIVVSPVLSTPSHPQALPLGWEGLRALTELANLPVYALGGMTLADLENAWWHGTQGIAAIRALWEAV